MRNYVKMELQPDAGSPTRCEDVLADVHSDVVGASLNLRALAAYAAVTEVEPEQVDAIAESLALAAEALEVVVEEMAAARRGA